MKNIPLIDYIACGVEKRPYLRNFGHSIFIKLSACVSKCHESKKVLYVTRVRKLAEIAMLPMEVTYTESQCLGHR